jgi:hypothetical protein
MVRIAVWEFHLVDKRSRFNVPDLSESLAADYRERLAVWRNLEAAVIGGMASLDLSPQGPRGSVPGPEPPGALIVIPAHFLITSA